MEKEGMRILTDALGMIPHLFPLVGGVILRGLDPRITQLVTLAVVQACRSNVRDFDHIDSTSADRSAVALALGTVSRPLQNEDTNVDQADQHFTSEQIRQIQALSLAVAFATRSFV